MNHRAILAMSTDITRARLSTRVVTKLQVSGWRSTFTQRNRRFLEDPWDPTFPCSKSVVNEKQTGCTTCVVGLEEFLAACTMVIEPILTVS